MVGFLSVFDDGRFARVVVGRQPFVRTGTAYAISQESSGPGTAAATKGTKIGPPERR